MQYGFDMGGKTAKQVIDEERESMLVDAGRYMAALTKIEPMTKQRPGAPNGVLNSMFKLTFTIQGGKFANRTVTRIIGVDHSNDTYMKMSHAFVGKLAAALGHGDEQITALDPFLNKPVDIEVAIKPPKEGSTYGSNNEITKFYPAGTGRAPAPASRAAPVAASRQAPPPPAGRPAPAGRQAPGRAAPQRAVPQQDDGSTLGEAESAPWDEDAA